MLVAFLLSWSACGSGREDGQTLPNSTITTSGLEFRNVTSPVGFVGDEVCFDCHETEYVGYQSHGMARSYYPLTVENRVEKTHGVSIDDPNTNLSYSIVEVDGDLYQEETERAADGRRLNVLRRRMDFVIGSGNAARTYLTENNGRLHQLPLTWYTQQGRWDFSPGYRVINHRFSRLVPDRCMACHNGYPKPVPYVEGKYSEVPGGIGCERCHGPGALHVEERLEVPEPASEIDDSIVNPAHLAFDRRLDVCQQCHLHTTVSMLREGRTPFGFRPSQSLSAHVSLFALQDDGGGDQIDVISHAARMRQSACFAATAGSTDPLECTTCHNPHEGFRDSGPSYFNDTCVGCHSIERLQSRIAGSDVASIHEMTSNCIECHMPKVEADDAPHSSFTDHRIRVVDPMDTVPPTSGHSPGELQPYFERDQVLEEGSVYRQMALIVYGQQMGQPELMRQGAEGLDIELGTDTTRGEALLLQGLAWHFLGQTDRAIPPLERAVKLSPNHPDRLNALARAYEAAGRSPLVVGRLYRRALTVQPAAANIRVNYGRFLQAHERPGEAEEQYRLAIAEDSWLAVAWYNLGTLLAERGDLEEAETNLRQAVHLDPLHADALGNLAALVISQGRDSEAVALFERAVEVAPDDAAALGNLGAYRLNQGRLTEAVNLLSRSVAADSLFVDALANLALAHFRSDDFARAKTMAGRALRVDPSNALARQVLAATE